MTLDRSVMFFAGSMVLISTLLIYFVSPWFLLFNLFIAGNLMQSSLTGVCPAASVFRAMGIKKGCAFE